MLTTNTLGPEDTRKKTFPCPDSGGGDGDRIHLADAL